MILSLEKFYSIFLINIYFVELQRKKILQINQFLRDFNFFMW